jgi:hypothetical protein
MTELVAHARMVLLSEPSFIHDAARDSQVGNSLVGGLLSITTGAPRWKAERAVALAVASIRHPGGER